MPKHTWEDWKKSVVRDGSVAYGMTEQETLEALKDPRFCRLYEKGHSASIASSCLCAVNDKAYWVTRCEFGGNEIRMMRQILDTAQTPTLQEYHDFVNGR